MQLHIVFVIAFIISRLLPLLKSSFFNMASGYHLVSFHFTLKDSLEHLFQGKSNGEELPQLLFIWKCLNFFFILKNSFSGYRILGWKFFLLALWVYWLAVFWTQVSDEKSHNLIEGPLYVIICFFLPAFKILSVDWLWCVLV